MPFKLYKVGEKYKLKKLKDNTFVKKEYKTKQSAINSAKAFMRYRKETPIVKGNMILNKKTKKII